MQQLDRDYKRVVIKIGSSLICSDGINLDRQVLGGICRQIIFLIKEGNEVVVVSSGAIALGMRILDLKSRPKELPYLQAAASTGSSLLINTYALFFGEGKISPAQILLTWEDFSDRKRYLNAKNTILTLLKLGKIVPVINENDTISTEEIKFGDNDRLSALVASLISADILIMLSDVDGLMDKEKNAVINLVDDIDSRVKALACTTNKKACVGGMVTKLEAADIATKSGIPCVIANGRRKDIILSVIKEPQSSGTLFLPKKGLTARKHWITFSAKIKGKIFIDEGAKNAIVREHRSLLSPGIVNVEGNFNGGDVVEICGMDNSRYARGITSVGSQELKAIKGKKYHKEIVHRDNMVIKR